MKVVVVGGVAGGASAAARLRRLDENAEIIILERGEYISFANCGLPYYIGEVIKKRDNLVVQSPESMKKRFNLDIRVLNDVKNIDIVKKQIDVYDIPAVQKQDNPDIYQYEKIEKSDLIKASEPYAAETADTNLFI